MAYYRDSCGPTRIIGSSTSWGPLSAPTMDPQSYSRPLSANFDRIFNVFERTNAFEYIKKRSEGDITKEVRHVGHGDVIVNRKISSSFERADCGLAAHSPVLDDEHFYREKILHSQARQLFPLQEDLADWINKTIGITYLSGENFLDILDNGVELCQLAAVIHEKAREICDQGLIVEVRIRNMYEYGWLQPVPQIRGRCWQRAARGSFFSRDNTENFIRFCRELGVHENLLFESDDLVLHNQPRQVILCLLEVARLATKFNIDPPSLVELEKEIAMEDRDSGLDSAMSSAAWQFRDSSPPSDIVKSAHDGSTSLPAQHHESHPSVPDDVDAISNKSGETEASTDSDVPLKPTNELDKRVQLMTRLMARGCRCPSGKCSRSLKVKKVGEGRYNIAGRNVFVRLLKDRHIMVRVGGGWDTLEHYLSRHEPCQVRLVTQAHRDQTAITLTNTYKDHSTSGTILPTDSNTFSISGKVSPIESKQEDVSSKSSSGKNSPQLRSSTPHRPLSARNLRSTLNLPLKTDSLNSSGGLTLRNRKQSAPPSFSTPATPTGTTRTPLTSSISNVPKKSRSMSLATTQYDKKTLNSLTQNKKTTSLKVTSASTDTAKCTARSARNQSVVSNSVEEPKKLFLDAEKINVRPKQTRSMSLATVSVTPNRSAIEESIRLTLETNVDHETTTKKPYLHIKSKYRRPSPREAPKR